VQLLVQERGQRKGGTLGQQAGADGHGVAQATADCLIDGDEVGEHPAPQVVLGQDCAQRGRGCVLAVGVMGGADIHSAGPGIVAGLAGHVTDLGHAALTAGKMRQVPGIPRTASECQLPLVMATKRSPVIVQRMEQYPAGD
jgi:hypothetical protein